MTKSINYEYKEHTKSKDIVKELLAQKNIEKENNVEYNNICIDNTIYSFDPRNTIYYLQLGILSLASKINSLVFMVSKPDLSIKEVMFKLDDFKDSYSRDGYKKLQAGNPEKYNDISFEEYSKKNKA